jgi:hypothetical protein
MASKSLATVLGTLVVVWLEANWKIFKVNERREIEESSIGVFLLGGVKK